MFSELWFPYKKRLLTHTNPLKRRLNIKHTDTDIPKTALTNG